MARSCGRSPREQTWEPRWLDKLRKQQLASSFNLVLSFGQTSGGISSTTGAWTGFVMVPSSATQLNMAFYNQGGTWDSNNGQNYNLTVS
jgi:Starch/carbohydrate-binding module (family 53)